MLFIRRFKGNIMGRPNSFAHREIADDLHREGADSSTQAEILRTLQHIEEQNQEKLRIDQEALDINERNWRLAQDAGRAFLSIAAPYYISQVVLHFFSEEHLTEHPIVKYFVLTGSIAFGITAANADLIDKFGKSARNTLSRAKKKGNATFASLIQEGQKTKTNIYGKYKCAGNNITIFIRTVPGRSYRKIKEKLDEKLRR